MPEPVILLPTNDRGAGLPSLENAAASVFAMTFPSITAFFESQPARTAAPQMEPTPILVMALLSDT